MEQKAEKKELKIMLGILLTVAVLAIIVAVVVVAVRAGTARSILFRGKYDYVDAIMVDGAVVTARDGEYMLVKEDRVISRRYTSLSYDPMTHTYSFTSPDGYKGELSSDGKELFRRKITGNELSSQNHTKDAFYYTEEGGIQTVHYKEQSLTLNAGETLISYDARYLSDMPLGVVLYGTQAGEYLTNMAGAPRFNLDACTIDASQTLVTVADGVTFKTYRLPDLTPLARFDGMQSAELFVSKNGVEAAFRYVASPESRTVIFYDNADEVRYELPSAPTEIVSIQGKQILVAFNQTNGVPDDVALYTPTKTTSGTYRRLTDELFLIGTTLLRLDTLQALPLSVADADGAEVLMADGKEYLLLDQKLYAYDNGTLSPMLSGGQVSYQVFQDKLYFIAGGSLYNNRLHAIASGAVQFEDENLISKQGNTYASLDGRTVENVVQVHKVNDFSDTLVRGEYVFLTASGAYQSFYGTVATQVSGTLERVYRAQSGGFMLQTNLGFVAGTTLLKSSAYDGYPQVFGQSGIAVVTGDRLDTYQLTARSEFSLTERRFYSNITIKCNEYGLAFGDQNGLYGYYSKDGKMLSGPIFAGAEVTESFVITRQVNGLYQLADRTGRRLIADRQIVRIESEEYAGYIMVRLSDGKTIMVAQNGAVVSEFAQHAFTIASVVTKTGDWAQPESLKDTLVNDESATYEVFLFEEGMQILKIMS